MQCRCNVFYDHLDRYTTCVLPTTTTSTGTGQVNCAPLPPGYAVQVYCVLWPPGEVHYRCFAYYYHLDRYRVGELCVTTTWTGTVKVCCALFSPLNRYTVGILCTTSTWTGVLQVHFTPLLSQDQCAGQLGGPAPLPPAHHHLCLRLPMPVLPRLHPRCQGPCLPGTNKNHEEENQYMYKIINIQILTLKIQKV